MLPEHTLTRARCGNISRSGWLTSRAQETTDFRPFSLACCTAMITEGRNNRKLIMSIETWNLLDHNQYAFRPGHGADTCTEVIYLIYLSHLQAVASSNLTCALTFKVNPRAVACGHSIHAQKHEIKKLFFFSNSSIGYFSYQTKPL